MPKPSTVFTWATNAAYVGGDEDGESNKTAPTLGKRQEGFEPAEEPAGETFNYMLNEIGEWIVYLDAGIFDGPIEITVADPEDVALSIPVGELNVDSAVFGGGVLAEGNVIVQGLFSLQGTYQYVDRVLEIPGIAGQVTSGTVSYPDGGYNGSVMSSGGAATIVWAIPLNVGDRIKSVALRVIGNAIAQITALDVGYNDSSGTYNSLHNSAPGVIAASMTTLTANNTDHTLATHDYVIVGVVTNAANIEVFGLSVTYDRP